jgi:hypothetical protein
VLGLTLSHCVAAGVLVPIAPVVSAASLRITAKIAGERLCAGDNDVATLVLTLNSAAHNGSKKTLIVAKLPGFGSPRLAASATQGRKGVFELEYDFHEMALGSSPPSFGAAPDARDFAVLKPLETQRFQSEVSVLLRRRLAENLSGTIVEGTRHAIQVPVLWSSPFLSLTEDEIEALRARWRTHGELVSGRGFTNWIEFSAPEIGNSKPCNGSN